MSSSSPSARFGGSPAELLLRFYHLPILAAIVSFMFWTRYQSVSNFRGGDGIALAAVDSWYHWRTTMYTVQNWPFTMPFDPWTGYPVGRYVGQFGTLYDQIIATVALLVGLGDPSTQTVFQVVLVMVPLLGALVAIPTYYIGARLGGRPGGLGAAGLLALFPQTFFYRTAVGQHQHHVAEVLFMAIAVLGFMVAIAVAEREKPVWELVVDRDWAGLRSPLLWGIAAGTAFGLYMLSWPPGVALVGIVGIYLVIKLSADHVRGVSPEPVAMVAAVAMVVAGTIMLANMDVMAISATSMGPLQPLLAFGVAVACVGMAWLARYFEEQAIEPIWYPGVVGAGILGGLVVLWVLAPDVFSAIVDNFVRRMTPFGEHVTDLTIAEAQPPDSIPDHMFDEYGLAFYTMLVGIVLLAFRPMIGGEHRGEDLFVAIWSIFLLSMAMTQVRFNYYLALAVAVVNAYLIGLVVTWADIPTTARSIRDVDGYQVMTIITVIMILAVPLLPPIAGTNVVDRGTTFTPSGDSIKWEGSNAWLAEHSPEVGDWAGAGNREALDYYGTYPIPDDGDFAYPEGSYGVMSWWDYGHLITVQAERIPHANPFQQHARSSSAFLTAQSEERAELVLDALPSGEAVHEMDEAELETAIGDLDDQQRGEAVRYVMIDDAMAGGKFSAISTWTGSYGDYLGLRTFETEDGEEISMTGLDESYDDTMLSRLYFDDGDGLAHYRLVHESEFERAFVTVAAREEGGNWQPVAINREVDAQLQAQLQQLVQSPQIEVEIVDQKRGAAVKTFERVEGATIEGTVEDPGANDTAVAVLPLNATTAERSFTYVQRAPVESDGSFSMTVPYATENVLGPDEGYTDSSVEAEDDYAVLITDAPDAVLAGDDIPSSQGTVDVPESAIYEGDSVTVELEPIDVIDPDDIDVSPVEEEEEEETNGTEDGDATTDGAENQTDENDPESAG